MKMRSLTTLPLFLVAATLAACSHLPAPQKGSAPPAALTNNVNPATIGPGIRGALARDPSTLIQCKNDFWVFSTGRGLMSFHSADLINWQRGPSIFTNPPAWMATAVPENRGMNYWAPDVAFLDGRYLLYYSASSFGKKVSAIGLATSPTLDPADPAYGWTDQGMIVASGNNDNFNTIDPSIFHDTDGSLWLAFGSYWSGIKLLQLDPKTGKRITPEGPIYSLAYNESIEASYLYQRGKYYYLFVNWGSCCQGTKSTYEIRVGRSEKITGPYLDRSGKNMLTGGGSAFLNTTRPYVGPGHAGIIQNNGKSWLSCHYEGVENPNVPDMSQYRGAVMAILPLSWTVDDWPQIGDSNK